MADTSPIDVSTGEIEPTEVSLVYRLLRRYGLGLVLLGSVNRDPC